MYTSTQFIQFVKIRKKNDKRLYFIFHRVKNFCHLNFQCDLVASNIPI